MLKNGWIWLMAVAASACVGRNYPEPAQPRYSGSARAIDSVRTSDTLRIVSFNIEYAAEMRAAIRVLATRPELRHADIILLQEMTAPAVKMAADSLGMHYVYYPAIYNRLVRHDIGNAILSRWPILEDAKLILPSRSRYAKTQRIATRATVQVGDRRLRVYSTHLGTPMDLGWDGRVAQIRAIVDDAASADHVIIGGDMNSADIGRVAREAGYLWATDTIPQSTPAGRLDHFFFRGFAPTTKDGVGTVRLNPGVSDHHPIWSRIVFAKR